MILNLLHRPTRGNEYYLYRFQQDLAHRLGLKVTLTIDYDAMQSDELVEEILKDEREFSDELAIWVWSLNDPQLGGSAPLWLLSQENKRKVIALVLAKFQGAFRRAPKSFGTYLMDASTLAILKELSPDTTTVIAGCFEEGVKVFHGCNHSWYLFSEGMPWGPWYPSKTHSLRPAADESDWSGVVAVPHLSRDLALSYEGRNDFFASHPANVQRGMANVGADHPYDFNLVDQYRLQEDYNNGFSFYHVHVGAGWLRQNPNVQDSDEITQGLYRELLEYLADLKRQKKLTDMHMAEFGDWFRQNVAIDQPFVNLAKEILYGSGKHYFWYLDPHFRITIDANQAGSIGDLRPYAGHFAAQTGPDSPHLAINSYPFIIHSQYRTGTSHHHSDGARTTLYLEHKDEKYDLCRCRTKVVDVKRDATGTRVKFSPAKIIFRDGLKAGIETTYEFPGDGRILIHRRLSELSDPQADLRLQEYFKGCYGFTEYPENMHGLRLGVEADNSASMEYGYTGRSLRAEPGHAAWVEIPQIQTRVSLESVSAQSASATDGHLFSPYYTLTLEQALTVGKEMTSCLKIAILP